MSDCVFCSIVRREAPAYILFENQDYLALLDRYPYGRGHTLVIPKTHYPRVWDVPDIGRYMAVVKKIALHLAKVMHTPTTYSFIFGEDVPHAHIHLLPPLPATQARLGAAFHTLREPQLTDTEAHDLLKEILAVPIEP